MVVHHLRASRRHLSTTALLMRLLGSNHSTLCLVGLPAYLLMLCWSLLWQMMFKAHSHCIEALKRDLCWGYGACWKHSSTEQIQQANIYDRKVKGVEIEPCDKVSPATSKREGAERSLTSRGTWFILWEMELKLCLWLGKPIWSWSDTKKMSIMAVLSSNDFYRSHFSTSQSQKTVMFSLVQYRSSANMTKPAASKIYIQLF